MKKQSTRIYRSVTEIGACSTLPKAKGTREKITECPATMLKIRRSDATQFPFILEDLRVQATPTDGVDV